MDANRKWPHVAGLSPTTSKLIELLHDKPAGTTITDAEVRDALELDVSVGGAHYSHLQSAIRHVEREYGVVWRRVYKSGCLRCMGAQERIEVVRGSRRRIARASRRAANIIGSTDMNQLPETERAAARALAAQVASLAMWSDSGVTKKLESKGVSNAPTTAEMLAMFRP